ncbi:hypothetical protein DCCM_3253 [Desulfocucumis palustris]|uniref:Uncharacterized protein n=1 Tax=Desulfocucumis palustris TaxID=1898651 RepID=A0A2L2XJN9_9FIRM|nr:hypothetical protein [Desulfocucumis palustris]GBF34141.1 hypothetical protein DCCM_3253 [Desulfocucumis palustris]
MNGPELIDLVHDILRDSTELSEIKDWKKVTGLITLKAPGCSIGIDKEEFDEYTRDLDEVTAHMRLVLWVKHTDPIVGEAQIRLYAQACRLILTSSRTLGGAVDDSFVKSIEYATADAEKSLIQHLAEIDYRVTYYSERTLPEELNPVESVNNDFD